MDQFIPFIIAHEAGVKSASSSNLVRFQLARNYGYSDDPSDPGGATMIGVTLKTYEAYCRKKGFPIPSKNTLRNIPFAHWKDILKTFFWDSCRADEISFAPLAWIIVDWVWASGPKVISRVQRILGVAQDNIVGPKTITAINDAQPGQLFDKVMECRIAFIEEICERNKALLKFRKGWLNRLSHITKDGLIF